MSSLLLKKLSQKLRKEKEENKKQIIIILSRNNYNSCLYVHLCSSGVFLLKLSGCHFLFQAIKEEIDGLQEELDIVINLGSELIAACGEPDKPIVKKSIDEVQLACFLSHQNAFQKGFFLTTAYLIEVVASLVRGTKRVLMFILQLNSAWDSLNKAWKDRVDKLEEAMQAAVQYQDGLQVRASWCVCWQENRAG